MNSKKPALMTLEDVFRDKDRMTSGILFLRDTLREALAKEGHGREERLEDPRTKVLNLLIFSYTHILFDGQTEEFINKVNHWTRPVSDEEQENFRRLEEGFGFFKPEIPE